MANRWESSGQLEAMIGRLERAANLEANRRPFGQWRHINHTSAWTKEQSGSDLRPIRVKELKGAHLEAALASRQA